ncbi:hypothetical protein [Trinickia sp.]|uniref:hypothetical protein n=1 Tax=Trinickia sp. TaxID=2571163 RepID=UPI003F808419
MDKRKRKRLSATITGALIAACIASAPVARAKVCSERDATTADAMVDHLDSWAQVNATFTKYGQCDDGEIAEGNSEGIARLLVDHWDTLPQLGTLIRHNSRLKGFILRHIDTTLDTDDLTKIATLSASSCPAGMNALCRELGGAALKASQ